MMLKVMLILAAAALLAGCGGDDEKRVDKVASCLKKDYGDFVSTDKPDLDLIAGAAKEGGISIETEKNEVNISFHGTETVAKKAVTVYQAARAAPKKVERHGTAVVAYTAKPTAQQERTIETCLDKG
jgi:hypothetical protein